MAESGQSGDASEPNARFASPSLAKNRDYRNLGQAAAHVPPTTIAAQFGQKL